MDNKELKPALDYIRLQIDEIAARARRTETIVHKLREKAGIPAVNPCIAQSEEEVTVCGHDVTLSQIKHALIGINAFAPGEVVFIYKEGDVIAEIVFYPGDAKAKEV